MSYLVTASELSILIESLGNLASLVKKDKEYGNMLSSFIALVNTAITEYKKQMDGGYK